MYDYEDDLYYYDSWLDYCDYCGRYLYSDIEFESGICDRCAGIY